MSRFLSETYDKPKLMETKVIKKIINDQNNQITFETKIKDTLIDIIKKYFLNLKKQKKMILCKTF